MFLVEATRRLVSKKKNRFTEDGFDLDLTYITNNLIAMGFPSAGMESTYRNPISQVKRFFEQRHGDHYRIYNLCSERSYNPEEFKCEVVNFPFDDHNCPEFELIKALMDDVDSWLRGNKQNVVSIHCKAGKGRTGLIISCYLVHTGMTADEALTLFGKMRTANGKGVTIPSQIRYVRYYEKALRAVPLENREAWNGTVPRNPLYITKLTLSALPKDIPKGSSNAIYFKIYNTDGEKIRSSRGSNSAVLESDGRVTLSCTAFNTTIFNGDIKFVLSCERSAGRKIKIFQFWINTSFVDGTRLVLCKDEIDGAIKDKNHKQYPVDFTCTLEFKKAVVNLDSDFSSTDSSPVPISLERANTSDVKGDTTVCVTEHGEARREDIQKIKTGWRNRASIVSSTMGGGSLSAPSILGRGSGDNVDLIDEIAEEGEEDLVGDDDVLVDAAMAMSFSPASYESVLAPLEVVEEFVPEHRVMEAVIQPRKSSELDPKSEAVVLKASEFFSDLDVEKTESIIPGPAKSPLEVDRRVFIKVPEASNSSLDRRLSASNSSLGSDYTAHNGSNYELLFAKKQQEMDMKSQLWSLEKSDLEKAVRELTADKAKLEAEVGALKETIKELQQDAARTPHGRSPSNISDGKKSPRVSALAIEGSVKVTNVHSIKGSGDSSSSPPTTSIRKDSTISPKYVMDETMQEFDTHNVENITRLIEVEMLHLVTMVNDGGISKRFNAAKGGYGTKVQSDGNIKQWTITAPGGDFIPSPKGEYGQFLSCQCYIVFQSLYGVAGESSFSLNVWYGSESSDDIRNVTMFHAQQLSFQLHNAACISRLIDGEETARFLKIFNGSMHVCKTQSAFTSTPIRRFIRIYGSSIDACAMKDMDFSASSLNPNYVHLVLTGTKGFLWAGLYVTATQLEAAAAVTDQLRGYRTIVGVVQGREGDDFWSALGVKSVEERRLSKELIINNVNLKKLNLPQVVNLYRVSSASEQSLELERILDFCRDDLFGAPVAILDSFFEVFVWIGSSSSVQAKDLAATISEKYMSTCLEDGLDEFRPLNLVFEGHEPVEFTQYFPDFNSTENSDAFDRADNFIQKKIENIFAEETITALESAAAFTAASSVVERAAPQRRRSSKRLIPLLQVQDPIPVSVKESLLPESTSRTSSSSSLDSSKGGKVLLSPPLRTESVSPTDSTPFPTNGIVIPYAELQGKAVNRHNINLGCREFYLHDDEFFKLFNMNKVDYAKLPKWKQVNMKKKLNLF